MGAVQLARGAEDTGGAAGDARTPSPSSRPKQVTDDPPGTRCDLNARTLMAASEGHALVAVEDVGVHVRVRLGVVVGHEEVDADQEARAEVRGDSTSYVKSCPPMLNVRRTD